MRDVTGLYLTCQAVVADGTFECDICLENCPTYLYSLEMTAAALLEQDIHPMRLSKFTLST